MQTPAITIKLVMIGDGNVGKTCILLSYTTGKFPTAYIPTVFENYSAKIKIDGKSINLGLWDTAGQEEFNKLRPLSYPQTDVFLICFSVDQPESFENALKKWYPELCENVPNVPKIFIGNKVDLRPEDIEQQGSFVKQSVANKVVSELGCTYMECSALSQDGLKQIFENSIRMVLNKKEQSTPNQKGQKGKRGEAEANKDNDSSCSVF